MPSELMGFINGIIEKSGFKNTRTNKKTGRNARRINVKATVS